MWLRAMSDLGGGLDQKPATQCPRALPVFDGCAGGQRGRVARGRIPWWCCTSVDGRRATFMAEVVLPSAARGAGRRAKRTVGGLLSMPLSPDRRSHLLRRECRDRQRKSCGVGAVQKRCLPRCLLPCLLLHLIRFMHSALALWLSHNAFLLFIGPPIGGNLQAWKLPVSSGGICHCNLESGTIHLRGCLAGPLTAFLQIHPQHAGKVMRQAEWIKAVGQLAQGGSSHAERDLPFRHDPSLPKECPILDNHKPQLQVRSSWLGCLASSIGAPRPPSTTKRPAGPWIRDSSLRQQRKAVDAGPSNLVNL